MIVVILSSLGNQQAKVCLDSLLETAPDISFDLHLIREKGFREQTLNYALKKTGTEDDVLFVGDDILFTPGWYEALQNNLEKADILGMSMLYPQSEKVQDRGYDLTGPKSLLEPRERGQDRSQTEPFGFRFCDAICGCFLYIKSEVFNSVSSFSEDGVNRWGEFIFITQARRAGFTCGVIDHFLHHGGISTKNNPDKKLSSASYLVEHGWWEDIVRQYVDPAWVKPAPLHRLDTSLINLLDKPAHRILFYGAGTVAEYIINNSGPDLKASIKFCSGLSEEVGMKLLGHTLLDAHSIDPTDYDIILMTPLHMGKDLFSRIILPRIPENYSGRAYFIETRTHNGELHFHALEIPVGA